MYLIFIIYIFIIDIIIDHHDNNACVYVTIHILPFITFFVHDNMRLSSNFQY